METPSFQWKPEDMEDEQIEFHTEDVNFELANPELLKSWIHALITAEQQALQHISFIFCSDDFLLDLNVQYLQHDTLTDIITFQYAKMPTALEGDIFISIDRVRENATTFGVRFEEELHRVMAHGVLHLCGYGDKTPDEKARMTDKENEALATRPHFD